jgi:CheY-like chemotaxis protein
VGSAKSKLHGKSVLVAEDEYLLARDLAEELKRWGATVVGPALTLADTKRLAQSNDVDGAILDIRLGEDVVFSVADELAGRNIPFVFVTGLTKAAVPERHRGVGLFEKPVDAAIAVGGLSMSTHFPQPIRFREYDPREMSLWANRVADAEAIVRRTAMEMTGTWPKTADAPATLANMTSAIGAMRSQPGNLRPTVQSWSTHNRLLAALPEEEFATLSPFLEPCELAAGTGIAGGVNDQHVYFPETAIVAVFSREQASVDLGPIGCEGAVGTSGLFGPSPFRFVVNEGGVCLRIPAGILSRAIQNSEPIRSAVMSYEIRRQAEIGEIARANALCTVEERLARYLLAYWQRSSGDHLRLTHEMLSSLLGVRRAGVTEALHLLEGKGAIRNTRRLVIIRGGDLLRRIAGQAKGHATATCLAERADPAP